MKKAIAIIITSCLPYVASAQGVTETLLPDDDTGVVRSADMSLSAPQNIGPAYSFDKSGGVFMPLHEDSLVLPHLNIYGRSLTCSYPFYGSGAMDWSLHKGLNVNIGASVFAMFGKHSHYHGAGFGQNISMMYALPLTNKLSVAVGGYFTNTSWSHDSYRDAGLNAVLGYKFNEHWEAYLFGQKSLTNKRMPLPLYDMNGLGDRIGAAVKYNFNPSFSIQVSVSASQHDLPAYGYDDNPVFR